MGWIIDHPGSIGIIVICAVLLYALSVLLRSRRRNSDSKCARCGIDLDDGQKEVVFDGNSSAFGTRVIMCPKCAALTERNHRTIFTLLKIMTILYIILNLIQAWTAGRHVTFTIILNIAAGIAVIVYLNRESMIPVRRNPEK